MTWNASLTGVIFTQCSQSLLNAFGKSSYVLHFLVVRGVIILYKLFLTFKVSFSLITGKLYHVKKLVGTKLKGLLTIAIILLSFLKENLKRETIQNSEFYSFRQRGESSFHRPLAATLEKQAGCCSTDAG